LDFFRFLFTRLRLDVFLFYLASHFHEHIDAGVDRFLLLCLASHSYQSIEKVINGFSFFRHAAS